MTVRIIKTDWFLGVDPNEGTVTFQIENGTILQAFCYDENFTEGESVEVDIDVLNNQELNIQSAIHQNPDKVQRLKKIGTWEYEGYGKIISDNPVKVDFGSIILETSWENDINVIGSYVYYKIDRLDISKP
jgi:hypothetical protein